MLTYCRSCVLPDSRPHLELDDEGVCNACRGHQRRVDVDWEARRRELDARLAEIVALGRDYDCVVPVSGGKDSTWQVAKCLEFGLKPLAVTWRSPGRNTVGQRNLDNLIRLGVDHLDYSINPDVERRFMLKTFREVGSTAVPMHLAIFSIPLRIAAQFGIPLVVYGENSAAEYGGDLDNAFKDTLDQAWVDRYGVTNGTTADDWVGDDLSAREVAAYRPPDEEQLLSSGVRAIFLGQFLPWDPQETRAVAEQHGFERGDRGPLTGYYDFADVDDDFISLHHWIKWYKFGFTRTYDNLSLEIRNGRLTRGEAVEIIRARGDETPHEDIERFTRFAGITRADVLAIAESFRSPQVWQRHGQGGWWIPGFLIDDWNWVSAR